MRDFIPPFRYSVFLRSAGVACSCVGAAWLFGWSPTFAFLVGAALDGILVAVRRVRQVRSYRTFKAYALHEAWASSQRFHLTMSPESFVAIFDDCLRSEAWRLQMATMLQVAPSECRQDLAGDPVTVRCYWKLTYPPEWHSEQRIGALIACIGSLPRSCIWSGYESDTALHLETALINASTRVMQPSDLPIEAQEFLFVTRRDLGWLLDMPLTFKPPTLTCGLNSTVELEVPCVLPLANGAYLHVTRAAGGGLEAVSVDGESIGTPLKYADTTALWSVWRHAVVAERQGSQIIVRVPSTALSGIDATPG
jgi:hypothetical protein